MALNILKTTLSRLFKTEGTEVDTRADCPLAPAETLELYLRLTTNCMEQADRMTRIPTSPKFNHEQCKYLADKLRMAVQSAHLFFEQINTWYSTFASPGDRARSLEVFKLLFALGKEVESFIQDCCKDAWIQSAITLTNVSEHISSLGFNLEYCTIVFSNRKKFGALPSLTVTEVASLRKAEAEIVKEKANLDEMRLKSDVSALIQSSESNSAEWQLAILLHERLNSGRMHSGANFPELDQANRPEIFSRGVKQMESLGSGACGTVYRALWLGAEVAKKTFHGPSDPDFWKEVSILEGLCHPNVVSLLWYMRDERKCYIIMELMDEDLYSLMQKRLEECGIGDPPFNISEAVHIILQVAEGMLYLHEKRIVHRDLKSKNILVRRVKATEVDVEYVHVKVTDFGLSKTKEKSMTASIQTLNMGTTRWMPPEMIKIVNDDGEVELSHGEVQLKYPFKSDVYSFGMVCYEILTGYVPFSNLGQHNEVKKKILGGARPQLPYHCPLKLRTLIEACWSSEPSRRPRFGDICAELRHLKCALFMNSAWAKAPRCFSLDEIMRMTNRFSKDNILSWGALTMVFKGVMVDTGEEVAVKRVFENYFRDLDKFNTQMELLSGLHHNNLVGFVGFCYAKEETILVFEYMPNDSLDKWLSEDARKVNLTWPVRRNICLGVANGIHYFHSLAQPRVIHRDIKASNILLDQSLQPRVAGFQFALLVSDDGSEIRQPHQCVGTLGYVAPECFDNLGQISEKVDVYSFGALLLEIVSGRRNIDPTLPEENLGEWALRLQSERIIEELIDPTLGLQPNEGFEAVRIVKVALLCMHRVVETRPGMSLVVEMLQGILDAEILRLGLEHDKERFGILVEMSKSDNQTCRQQAASKLRMVVARKQNLTEFEVAGGIAALVALLEDLDPNCQRDALVALQTLPSSIAIPLRRLPVQTILDFLSQKWPIDMRNAAAGLLDLMVRDKAVCADILVKTKGALEAALNLLEKTADSPGSQKIAFVLLEMAKEDQSVRLRITEPGLRGLDILVKYVSDHVKDKSRNEFKRLLIATLVLFCGSGDTYQEAVINADGHVFLLTSLQEKILKADAAQGLLHLISNTRTSEKVLEAGFVTTAMHSIDVRFPCTDIALGLARISSTPEGLNQIYSDPFSVSALLILLEHCPDPTGKDAAASVIARLYPRLIRTEEDVARQTKIAEACDLFFRDLDPLDISHFKAYFEALAVIAAEAKGRKMIHEYRGHLLLIRHLAVPETDIQCLVLKILAEMSSDVSENGVETRAAKMIRSAFMEERISDELFKLFNSEEFNRRTESMMNALILIRNLSLAGSNACEQLAEQGAVALLLDVLKRHEGSMSVVPELAVEALEKLVDDPKGKQVFLKGGGMKSVVAVLKLEAYGRTRDSKFSTITILIMFVSKQIAVAKDPQTCKAACAAVFDCDILSALNRIMFNGETSRIRWQAAVLMKLLAMYGPTSRVCRAMKSEGCLDALIHLRTVQHCDAMANDLLKFVGEKSKDCKRYIDGRLSQVDASVCSGPELYIGVC